MATEIEQLRQEAEILKNQIRVRFSSSKFKIFRKEKILNFVEILNLLSV